MPFPSLVIKPKFISRGTRRRENEEPKLLDHNNQTLSNLILQLANLSGQAEHIFSNLLNISADLTDRMKILKTQMNNVENIVKNLDAMKVKVGIAMGDERKSVYKAIADRSQFFQSDNRTETGLFMKSDCPSAVVRMREESEEMPQLHILDKFRTDNKLSSKIYSNPDLFFLAWQDSIQMMISEQHKKSDMKVKKSVKRSRVRRVKRAKPSRIEEAQKLKRGAEFVDENSTQRGDEEDEYDYFDDEEWSSSEDEDNDGTTNGNQLTVPGQTNSIKQPVEEKGKLHGFSIKVPTPTAPPQNHVVNGNDDIGSEYSLEDLDIPDSENDFPLPPPPLSLDELTLNGDLPPPPPVPIDHDYSGLSANYNIQNVLNSINSEMWST